MRNSIPQKSKNIKNHTPLKSPLCQATSSGCEAFDILSRVCLHV